MSTNAPPAALAVTTATALRRLFDASFAAPTASLSERLEDLLAIRMGSDPYALRTSEIAGLHVGVKIVPVPSPVAQLLGIAAIRGMMAPIYDLAALLRYPPAANPRWLIFARAPQSVGLAFETFESHLQASPSSLATENVEVGGTVGIRRHLRGTVLAAGTLRPIIHLASVLEMIGGKRS
ncbi:MAG: chemotaxis protein CheW [Steroidobacteraceae bacterium]